MQSWTSNACCSVKFALHPSHLVGKQEGCHWYRIAKPSLNWEGARSKWQLSNGTTFSHAEVLPFIALHIDLCRSCVNFVRIDSKLDWCKFSWTLWCNCLASLSASRWLTWQNISLPFKALATTTVPCLDVLKISVGIDVGSSTPRPARHVGSANNCSSASDRLPSNKAGKKHFLIVSCSTMNISYILNTFLQDWNNQSVSHIDIVHTDLYRCISCLPRTRSYREKFSALDVVPWPSSQAG